MLEYLNLLLQTDVTELMVSLPHFLVVGIILFSLGIAIILVKRNAIWMLMGVELILNSAALNFAAFSYFNPTPNFDGQIMSIFIVIIASAEAAVGLAIILLIHRHKSSKIVENPDSN